MIHQRKILKAIAYAILLCFTSLTGAQPLYAVPLNHQTPTGFESVTGNSVYDGHENISQTGMTAVNSWGDFSIGADATVNFTGPNGFNSFNYVRGGGKISEIYGQLNAVGGNIFIANPAGVQIGNSAQINVGSLYVTNKDLESEVGAIAKANDAQRIRDIIAAQEAGTAQLMSLGSITSATSVTFDGGRIVLDTDRLFSGENGVGSGAMDIDNLTIQTTDANNVVLGYTKDTDTATKFDNFNIKVSTVDSNGKVTLKDGKVDHGYQWVRDINELQAMGEDLDGWYALRNAIDANYTASEEYKNITNETSWGGFKPIGSDDTPFSGRFDGLGYDIFGLTINRQQNFVGLFGAISGSAAVARNFTINSGSISGLGNVGSVAGAVRNGALIENITNTADVSGENQVGGIAGTLSSQVNSSEKTSVNDLVNYGSVRGEQMVGGILGYSSRVNIGGATANFGSVSGKDDNSSNQIGGIVGQAYETTIGDGKNQIINQLNVTGGYNVGGIVGSLRGSNTVQNAANYGDVTAKGYVTHNDDDAKYKYHKVDGILDTSKTVNVANAGGIAGRADGGTGTVDITNVQNYGDVSAKKEHSDDLGDYYTAGNVGGVVGRAENTTITNAENSENHVAGAHNVGGVVGYLTGESVVDSSQNDGGDITATGARYANDFVKEAFNPGSASTESVIIGNIGGIAGYLYGDKAQIKNSANRGSVHTADVTGSTIPLTSQAANAGGVVGKVDSSTYLIGSDKDKKDALSLLRGDGANAYGTYATISNSYNTGSVSGFMGVGGIAGHMYKGSVAGSYNLGALRSTRIANPASVDPVNMGGIVGDTGALKDGDGTVIYDVYNAGTIGDDEFTFLGRHVGGVVGRFSGTLDKAYNTGNIYNGYSVTGGVVGYWLSGDISNVFNTGNITVVNKDLNARNSLVGGIIGAANAKDGTGKTLSYAYNLGTLRSFIPKEALEIKLEKDNYADKEKVAPAEGYEDYRWIINNVIFPGTDGKNDSEDDGKYDAYRAEQLKNINTVGGIIGGVTEYVDGNTGPTDKTITVTDVYSTGNMYAARWSDSANNGKGGYEVDTANDRVSAIWGNAYTNANSNNVDLDNAYFIKPNTDEDAPKFSAVNHRDDPEDKGYTVIDWGDRNVQMNEDGTSSNYDKFGFKDIADGTNDYTSGWRFVDGTLPILNAFTPNTAKDQSWNTGSWEVQFGTAANPLLTIINSNGADISLSWEKLGLSGAGSLALYGGGNLTLTDFGSKLGRYYNGILFSEGDLSINVSDAADLHNLGSGSRLYGENITFDAGTNDSTLYGTITSTNGDITIRGGNVSVIGSLVSSKEDESTLVPGIAQDANHADNKHTTISQDDLNDPTKAIATVEEAYAYEAHRDDKGSVQSGSITVDAKGSAEVLYGNMGAGRIETEGDFTVSGKDSVYVDSDLHIGGDLRLNSDGEIVLDLSNMGSYNSTDSDGNVISGKDNLHENFLDHFKNDGTEGKGTIKVGGVENAVNADNFMIAIDMWDYQNNEFDLDKYDRDDNDTLAGDINSLKITMDGIELGAEKTEYADDSAKNHTFIWVDSAEQLAGIQKYKDADDAQNPTKEDATHILEYNFALKDNIDASSIKDYTGIASNTNTDGTKEAFTGTFDGRGFAIIGLDVNRATDEKGNETTKDVANAGIFGNIGHGGTVKDLNVYSSKFTGGDTAGAIAGRSEGTITGVETLGNRVEVTGVGATTTVMRGNGSDVKVGENVTIGAAGGIVGVNNGTIENSSASDTVIAGERDETDDNFMTVAGGVAGINQSGGGMIMSVTSTSAVLTDMPSDTNDKSITHGLGGIVGVNEGMIWDVAAFGATNGTYGALLIPSNEYVGGIAGVNYGWLLRAYNEAAVIGASNVGGIAGKNEDRVGLKETPLLGNVGFINNSVNAGSVTSVVLGENSAVKYTGGIAGSNFGEIQYGRNTGAVTGGSFVGGMVGRNDAKGTITGVSNAISASITGREHVGGIAGTNAGAISGSDSLTNEGSISGNQYVGGIAGENQAGGVIENVNTSINLDVSGTGAKYFGGVTGTNSGTITNAHNTGDVSASEAEYVGGITGVNEKDAVLENAGNSGNVSGGSMVGGVAGVNYASHDGGTIINSGTVTAENGGAAGIFYENHADLSNVTLINSGQVNGGGNTGGVIGVNSGTISGSTLANTGYVKADSGENVGGLIGKNTGSVIGGRNEADTMYVHKIYNNGRVSGGTNVGGLIGNNEGNLTAGYNTGNVRGQQNVGGIAGTNNGSISEVFNTVMTGDAEATGSIFGANNVGGLVGHNEKDGTLTDAYNTTAVNGGGVKGNAVGTNDGAVKNVYAWNTNGKLIGGGSGAKENTYSFVSGDGSANFVIPALGRMESESYEGFDFGSTWKNYDGWSLPMLKVFLTKGEVSQNGVTAADGLAAFNNANSLIVFVPDPETGGMYMTVFSAQIAGSFGPDGVFNPNNLGYDLEGVYVRGNNNGFLHSDGWDRIKNFRERKAELYFHNGGMEYAEEM